MERLFKFAEEIGFSHYGQLNTKKLDFNVQVRKMCQSDRCRNYGRCWTCPPYCGTLEEISQKAAQYKYGILLQSTGIMEDDFDVECMMDTESIQKKRFNEFVQKARKIYPDCLPMTSGGCTICEKCTCPDSPCRFPDKAMPSMEAYGLVVSEECRKSNLPYYYGPRTITFTSCLMF